MKGQLVGCRKCGIVLLMNGSQCKVVDVALTLVDRRRIAEWFEVLCDVCISSGPPIPGCERPMAAPAGLKDIAFFDRSLTLWTALLIDPISLRNHKNFDCHSSPSEFMLLQTTPNY